MSPKGNKHISAVRGYAICTSPRAGSNFLCQNLTSTGVLGRPSEYFNGAARRALDDPLYPDEPADQIRWILTKGATPNGVYGVKLFAHQQDRIAPHLSWTQALPALHFIYLERRDLLGQALSCMSLSEMRRAFIPAHCRHLSARCERKRSPRLFEPSFDAFRAGLSFERNRAKCGELCYRWQHNHAGGCPRRHMGQ